MSGAFRWAAGPSRGTVLSRHDGVNDDIKSPRVRIEEAVREIGVLLVALAPLDAAFSPDAHKARSNLLLFITVGVTLFLLALVMERRRSNVRSDK
jgi:hypothetical protein